MYYENMVSGRFLERPNRFVAYVEMDGKCEKVHVKNTGRCRELLTVGTQVWCRKSENIKRKTAFDLICVRKDERIINMDSQAPNIAVAEWLQGGGLGQIEELRPEVFYGNSRFDFAFLKDGRQCYLEVKGVTLEQEGICAFPDAPTVRGTKHLTELSRAAQEGYGAYVLFVIQMEGVRYLRPNEETDPAFARALHRAKEQGVTVMAMDCTVTPETMTLHKSVEVRI